MAIHPDDPPWDIFGLPRIVGKEEDYDKLFAAVPDKHNGMTFCTGSLGAGRFNDLPKMAAKYANRIYFAHLRQLKFVNETDFYENGHQTSEGNVDIYASYVRLVYSDGSLSSSTASGGHGGVAPACIFNPQNLKLRRQAQFVESPTQND